MLGMKVTLDLPDKLAADFLLFQHQSASIVAAGAVGSPPLSGSVHASAAATRRAEIDPMLLVCMPLIAVLVYYSGALGSLPLAAVIGTLLGEAWLLIDRASVGLVADWARG